MTILNRHITVAFLLTAVMTFLVLTMVISIGVLFRFTDLLARGAAPRVLLGIFLNGIPFAAAYSVPISSLVAVLLLFSRMSADMEIVATRACGISFRELMRMPVLLAALLAAMCFYLLNEVAPASRFRQQTAFRGLGGLSPLDLLDEGRFNHDFPGVHIYFGRREKDELHDVIIIEQTEGGHTREISAASGSVDYSADRAALSVVLRDVRIDPIHPDVSGVGFAGELPVTLSLERLLRRPPRRRESDYDFHELADRLRRPRAYDGGGGRGRTPAARRAVLLVEMHKRMALAASCFAFVMLGAPLGMKNHRRESSINIAIGLAVVFGFYLFVIGAESLADRPAWQPWMLPWIPILAAIAAGYGLARRAD